jgi:Zn-dependent peptidase ImmA (M78 family)
LEELHLLKHKYGLSMSAWVYRAKDLGIISPALTQKFYTILRQRNWSVIEPGTPYPQELKPSRLKQLVLRAYAESIISETKAAELLGQSLITFHEERLNQNA